MHLSLQAELERGEKAYKRIKDQVSASASSLSLSPPFASLADSVCTMQRCTRSGSTRRSTRSTSSTRSRPRSERRRRSSSPPTLCPPLLSYPSPYPSLRTSRVVVPCAPLPLPRRRAALRLNGSPASPHSRVALSLVSPFARRADPRLDLVPLDREHTTSARVVPHSPSPPSTRLVLIGPADPRAASTSAVASPSYREQLAGSSRGASSYSERAQARQGAAERAVPLPRRCVPSLVPSSRTRPAADLLQESYAGPPWPRATTRTATPTTARPRRSTTIALLPPDPPRLRSHCASSRPRKRTDRTRLHQHHTATRATPPRRTTSTTTSSTLPRRPPTPPRRPTRSRPASSARRALHGSASRTSAAMCARR